MKKSDYIIIIFYKFITLRSPQAFAKKHREACTKFNLTGRIIVAEEGINGTLEGTKKDIRAYVRFLKTDKRFEDIIIKQSRGTGKAFPKLKVKIRDEVVTLGAGRFNIKKETAQEVTAAQLEKMYKKNEDFIILDLRNDYEIASGKFEKTFDPGLTNFRDLPRKIKELKKIKDKKVVAVCTAGIRCEKATCLLKKKGFTNLYQLKDGIHTYMKKYPGKNFKGSLFVFDNRLVTEVVPIQKKEVIGQCFFCQKATETYYSDDRIRPSKKVLSCGGCYEKNKKYLRAGITVL